MAYRFQVASNVLRDGLGVELTDTEGNVLAEVFRCDADHTLTVSLFCDALPFAQVEKLVLLARDELVAFEDGTPLPIRMDRHDSSPGCHNLRDGNG
ncbi:MULTISPECIES: hypothetical protein [Burkholderia]|uniref:hypothetical protein n=1 Tax=Burkholderia TaxID=32008 RepID=UPI0009B0031A|nr:MULTISPECIES: hypothetical protein [Burkholderia]MBN3737245.1 hypothetical protein [Burkholderia sp. Tr-20355]MCA8300509.1 hypothetical protein [Burkholderia seminalis]MCA8428984.1 hypothetical protein [Burkholderia seminalis]MDN7585877.1 hypothetical protein [Burkholderia seminalis]MDN7849170.1 hypothetical protein [Burkholderia seminalis]